MGVASRNHSRKHKQELNARERRRMISANSKQPGCHPTSLSALGTLSLQSRVRVCAMASVLILPTQESDEMKLRQEDREWFAKEVAEAAKSAVAAEADKFRPHGVARVVHFLREWGLAGTIVTVFVGLLALASAAWYNAFSRVAKEASFETATTKDLGDLRTAIHELQGQASIEPVSSAIQMATASKVTPSPEQVKKLSSQLMKAQDQYPDVPAVWKTTGDFINFKFSSLVPKAQQIHPSGWAMDCRTGSMEIQGRVATFKNCTLDLSDRLIAGNAISEVVFDHCIIRYRGGSVPPYELLFRGCLFDFDVPTVPPPRGAETMRLLAQALNVTSVDIPS